MLGAVLPQRFRLNPSAADILMPRINLPFSTERVLASLPQFRHLKSVFLFFFINFIYFFWRRRVNDLSSHIHLWLFPESWLTDWPRLFWDFPLSSSECAAPLSCHPKKRCQNGRDLDRCCLWTIGRRNMGGGGGVRVRVRDNPNADAESENDCFWILKMFVCGTWSLTFTANLSTHLISLRRVRYLLIFSEILIDILHYSVTLL